MGLDPILSKEKPDVVLVYGDTNTTLAGALASYKLHIPTGHVESGLRERIWRPEEINKLIADHCSNYCFCPIQRAVNNLVHEGISEERIFFTGDVTYDAFISYSDKAEKKSDIVEKIGLPRNEYILVTAHRAETVDYYDQILGIVEALIELAEEYMVVFPMHPRTEDRLKKFGLFQKMSKVDSLIKIESVGYLDFLKLLMNSKLVMTDSSGVLKEAFYACKPSVTLDDTSEYEEIFDSGFSVLAGKDKERIVRAVRLMISELIEKPKINPFGDGNASDKILNIITKSW
jgi:UDP-N-acetylglucosamine 2-epimerase